MDVRFYDFSFKLLYILPEHAVETGIVSMNTTTEFNGNGSFELVFHDSDLMSVIREHINEMLVFWNGFQGYATGYLFETGNTRIFGKHLNGLLGRRIVLPDSEPKTGTAEEIVCSAVSSGFDFLSVQRTAGFVKNVTYTNKNAVSADSYIQAVLSLDNAGYKISADIVNKKLYFAVLLSKTNPLMLSENNLNAYNFSENYDNKSFANSGWYLKKEETTTEEGKTETVETWTKLSEGSEKSGLYRVDAIFKSDTEDEAKNELAEAAASYEATADTKNITYGTDYHLGDVVRLQVGSNTVLRKVAAVNRWLEDEYGEEPVLKEVKDD